MAKTDKVENKDQKVEKSTKKSVKSSYSKKKKVKKNILNDIIDKYKDCLISIYLSFIIEKKHVNEAKKSLENCTIIDVFNLFKTDF